MIALGRRKLAAALATVALVHLLDRILAGVTQCAAAGTCPW